MLLRARLRPPLVDSASSLDERARLGLPLAQRGAARLRALRPMVDLVVPREPLVSWRSLVEAARRASRARAAQVLDKAARLARLRSVAVAVADLGHSLTVPRRLPPA